ncbi:MAG: hypothetical protein HEQ40_05180 [Lacibacter sp.]|jgi:hypothetical protein
MTDKLFDEFIKSKLERYDSGAPMHVWERMQKEKDDRRGFFFLNKRYWLLAIGLLLMISTGVILLETKSKQINQTIVQKNGVSNEQKNSVVPVAITDQSSSDVTSTSSNQSLNKTSAVTASANETLVPASSTKTDFVSTDKAKNKQFSKSAATEPVYSNKRFHQSTSVVNASETSNQASTPQSVQEPSSDATNTLQLTGSSLRNQKQPILKLGAIALPQNKPSCPTINGPRRRDLYLEFYIAPDYNVRSINASNTSPSYLAERKNTEDYRTSYSTGVRLVKNLGEKTLIKTGVNYSQINERLKLVTENSRQLTQIITIRTVVRSPGDTLFIRDTMYYEQTGTRYRTTYNRYRFIDLPVIFSYEFGNPELMHFAINAGPVFNITSMYSGEVLDSAYKPVRISTASGSNANHWRSNIGIGMFASVSIYKRLNDRVHLFGEPYMRYNFNPVTQSTNYVKQRYIITGMQLGIRYNLLPKGQRYR